MSDTPRTDKAVTLTFAAGHNTVCPNFARQLERELAEARARADELKRTVNNLRYLPDDLDKTPMTDAAEFSADVDNANGPSRVNSEFCRLVERRYYFQKARAEKYEAELKRKDEALAEIQMRTEVGADGTSDPFTQLHLIRRAAALAQGGKEST